MLGEISGAFGAANTARSRVAPYGCGRVSGTGKGGIVNTHFPPEQLEKTADEPLIRERDESIGECLLHHVVTHLSATGPQP